MEMKFVNDITEDEMKELLPNIGDRIRFGEGIKVRFLLQLETTYSFVYHNKGEFLIPIQRSCAIGRRREAVDKVRRLW